jgi:myo-inositol-1(or 4)-monophosphatase
MFSGTFFLYNINCRRLKTIMDQVIAVCHEAGVFIASHFDKVNSDDIVVKGHNSLVSFVDQGSERILVEKLSQIFPEAGFVTEEETVDQVRKEMTWIIDPLDGTTNFLHSIPHFSISIGLHDGDHVILGVVHDVMRNETYHAIKGQGAFCNQKPLKVSNETSFADTLIGTGYPYLANHTLPGHFRVLNEVLANTRGIRRFGSAALDLCMVASGRFGAFYEQSLNAYDIAAGALIVQEAGGIVSDYSGSHKWLWEGEILASAPQYHDRMLEVLKGFYNN